MAGTKRLTLEFSEETYEELSRLAKESHRSMKDIVREGIALRSLAEQEKKEGKNLAITKDDKIETKIIIS